MRKLFIVLSVLAIGLVSRASDDHNHEASVDHGNHGGIVRDAEPFKAELVLKGDLVAIYVYDYKKKTEKGDLVLATLASTSISGEMKFPKEKKGKKVTFIREGEAYQATIKGIGKADLYDLHVYLEEAGKKTKIDFGVDNIH